MKGVITEFTKDSITFLEDGVNELQVLDLADWIKPEFFRKGPAEVTMKENVVSFVSMESDQQEQQKGTDKGTDKSGWEDDMISFEELLNDAHKKFPDRLQIYTEIVRDADGKPLLNVKDKFCIMKAKVVIDGGLKKVEQVFEAHGDTTSTNVKSSHIIPHFIRMAETRAIARALRWATNNATVAAEETAEGKLPEAKKNKKKGEKDGKQKTQ